MIQLSIKQIVEIFEAAATAAGCVTLTRGESHTQAIPNKPNTPPVFWLEYPFAGSTGKLDSYGIKTRTWAYQILLQTVRDDAADELQALSTTEGMSEFLLNHLKNVDGLEIIATSDLTVHGTTDDRLTGIRVEVTFQTTRYVPPCVPAAQ